MYGTTLVKIIKEVPVVLDWLRTSSSDEAKDRDRESEITNKEMWARVELSNKLYSRDKQIIALLHRSNTINLDCGEDDFDQTIWNLYSILR